MALVPRNQQTTTPPLTKQKVPEGIHKEKRMLNAGIEPDPSHGNLWT